MAVRSTSDPLKLIVLGTILLVLFPFLWFNIYAEYRGMGSTPRPIDLATVASPAPNRGRWVTIPQLTVECDDHAVEGGRSPHTLYAAHAPGYDRLLVIDAGTGRSACNDLPRTNLRGVLRPLTERRRHFLEGRGLRVAAASDALVLNWGETPKSSQVLLAVLPVVALVGLILLGMGVRQLRRRVRFKVTVRVHRNQA